MLVTICHATGAPRVRQVRIDELVDEVERRLERSQLSRRDAQLLVAGALGLRLGDLELARLMGTGASDAQVERVRELASRRARREPLQHLLGEAPFTDFTLRVGPGVFVPRPETEVLVDHALTLAGALPPGAIADIGSGSGAIAISVARALPQRQVIALEASPFAWPWLRQNIRELAPQVQPRFGDWHAGLESHAEPLAALLSNPPYVPQSEIPSDPEVRLFDPELALYSGQDGLVEIRRIAQLAARRLSRGGIVAVEHTEQQGEQVRSIFTAAGLQHANTIRDLSGRERHTFARRRD